MAEMGFRVMSFHPLNNTNFLLTAFRSRFHFWSQELSLLLTQHFYGKKHDFSLWMCMKRERTGSDNNGLVTGINRWEERKESERKDKVEEWGGRRQSMCNPFKYNKLLTWYTRPHHCHFSLLGFLFLLFLLLFFIFFSSFFHLFLYSLSLHSLQLDSENKSNLKLGSGFIIAYSSSVS